MNIDEIKDRYHMPDVLSMYGIQPNRAGFIPCPFHDETKASMKIYPDKFYCFGCNAHGDIFDFVMQMDSISFNEAFAKLGGTHGKQKGSSLIRRYHRRSEMENARRQEEKIAEAKKMNNMMIGIYLFYMQNNDPLSEIYALAYNEWQKELYRHAELNGLEYMW